MLSDRGSRPSRRKRRRCKRKRSKRRRRRRKRSKSSRRRRRTRGGARRNRRRRSPTHGLEVNALHKIAKFWSPYLISDDIHMRLMLKSKALNQL